MARTTRRPPSRRWRTSCYRLGPSPGWDAFSQEEILQHELPLQAVRRTTTDRLKSGTFTAGGLGYDAGWIRPLSRGLWAPNPSFHSDISVKFLKMPVYPFWCIGTKAVG